MKTLVKKILTAAAILPLAVLALAGTNFAKAANGTVNVTMVKFIDGAQANATSSNGASFAVSADWAATNSTSNGTFTLAADSDTPFTATSANLSSGANFSLSETMGNGTAASCDTDGANFSLQGYTVGDTLAQAAAATPTLTPPALTNITTDKTVIVWNQACSNASSSTAKVTIAKYINGEQATAVSANNATFGMSATWSATNIGSGTGSYTLDANSATPYQAQTVALATGASYSTQEVLDGDVTAADCTTNPSFALAGYTTGDTLAQAAAATPTLTPPALTNITTDKAVIVWNNACGGTSTSTTAKVHILKYLDGAVATASSSASYLFPVPASWQANGGSSTSATITLGNNYGGAADLYGADSAALAIPASFSLAEDTTSSSTKVVASSSDCAADKYLLQGYRVSSVSFADAANQALSTTAPNFSNLVADKYVIISNQSCANAGQLQVTGVTVVKGTAIADDNWADGWKYVFHITAPDGEQNLSMKFSNWLSGSNTLPVAGNMRISSAQADNSGATVLLNAADTYSSPALHMVSDLDAGTTGRQVDVTVEVKVPTGTPNGTYSTNYGVQTL